MPSSVFTNNKYVIRSAALICPFWMNAAPVTAVKMYTMLENSVMDEKNPPIFI